MTPDEFRRAGHQTIEWIARYMEEVESYPVRSEVAPGQIRANLEPGPTREGEPFEAILADVDRVLLPGILHWQSPHFFGYFPCNRAGPSVLGELLSAGLGVQGMLWSTSPACTELETHVLDWLVELLDLPEKFASKGAGGGVIQDSASSATLCAMLAARERAGGAQVLDRLVAYASNQAHSSVEKAARIAGLRPGAFRAIDVDEHHAMRPDRLESAILSDRQQGKLPFFACATLGTTSSMAMDPLPQIGAICEQQRVWLHVDGAMAGSAALCPEFRFFQQGLNLADSYCFNPHKWLPVNFDCDCLFLGNRQALIEALNTSPAYLSNQATQTGGVIDYRNWQIPLGRRFRSLKLWMTLRWFGVERLQMAIREHVALAKELAEWIAGSEHLVLSAPVSLNLVCFRHRRGDRASQQLIDRLNSSGKIFLTHTMLADRIVLRLCIGQWSTQRRDVENAWSLLQYHTIQVQAN